MSRHGSDCWCQECALERDLRKEVGMVVAMLVGLVVLVVMICTT